jgi:hypothetical protein
VKVEMRNDLNDLMNKWKIYFWACFAILIFVGVSMLYLIIDQGVSLSYMKEGYADTEEDLSNLTKIINETDLSKEQIRASLIGPKRFRITGL